MKKKSLFSSCIEFFNSYPINQTISRRDFMINVENDAVWTRDNYRRYLCKAGFLESIKLGQYRRIRDIPNSLTLTDLKTIAYDTTLNGLFMELKYLNKESSNGKTNRS